MQVAQQELREGGRSCVGNGPSDVALFTKRTRLRIAETYFGDSEAPSLKMEQRVDTYTPPKCVLSQQNQNVSQSTFFILRSSTTEFAPNTPFKPS
jgi:hypothetical protein